MTSSVSCANAPGLAVSCSATILRGCFQMRSCASGTSPIRCPSRAMASASERFDALVSCLASRTGAPRDAWAIDHRAHVEALRIAKAAGVQHLVLLSAICVQKPLLAFQHAKLAFEKELRESGLRYSIVQANGILQVTVRSDRSTAPRQALPRLWRWSPERLQADQRSGSRRVSRRLPRRPREIRSHPADWRTRRADHAAPAG
jgi:hypothetical protein